MLLIWIIIRCITQTTKILEKEGEKGWKEEWKDGEEGGKKTRKKENMLKRKYNKWETYTKVRGIILNISITEVKINGLSPTKTNEQKRQRFLVWPKNRNKTDIQLFAVYRTVNT